MEIWGAHSIMFVWFITNADGMNAADIYNRILGGEPDQAQNNRIPSPHNPFLSSAAGQIDSNLQFQVNVQPGRVDLVCTACQQENDTEDRLFDAKEVLQATIERIKQSGGISDNVVRLSIVLHLHKPVANYDEGVQEIYKSIGLNPGIDSVSDVLFQINARKNIDDSIALNRLLQFSVSQTQAYILEVGGTNFNNRTVPLSKTSFSARRTYDFNTVPSPIQFDRNRQIAILHKVATEIFSAAEIGAISALGD